MQRGFSLVELSIVLVILGLLTGGILAGQSLIRASQLRTITTEYDRYYTAVQAFKGKYFMLPGDLTNATSFWGDNNTACPDATIANGTPGTCNGDGDGRIASNAPSAYATGELWQFWNQLALAGLIEGTYTGVNGNAVGRTEVYGSNSPASKIANAGWTTRYLNIYNDEDSNGFQIQFQQNIMYLGMVQGGGGLSSGSIVKPEEAWNLDTKADDGLPAQGKWVARKWSNCTTAASNTELSAAYNLSNSGLYCAFIVRY